MKDWRRTTLRKLLDVILLHELEKNSEKAYDIKEILTQKYRLPLSSGTIYNRLYCLERDGLLSMKLHQRAFTYSITAKGLSLLNMMVNVINEAMTQIKPEKEALHPVA